jgi:hypothetical protein
MKKETIGTVLVLCALLAVPHQSAVAQTTYGTLQGTVRDATQAVMPGVTLQLKSQATNAERTATSNNEGTYRFLDLQPGLFVLTSTQKGFKTFLQSGITIRVGETTVVDVTLDVGSTSETVNVQASVTDMQPTTTHLSTVITSTEVVNLPLAGRSYTGLALLAPGVTVDRAGGVGSYVVNGERATTNTFTVDGTDVNNPYWNNMQGGVLGTATPFASLDGIAEIRVMTSTFSAEYGRTVGGTITAVTKSGSNQFHGDVYEYWRNDVLDANEWFANQAGASKPPLRFNNFGGTLGGPIKRDKVFFFFLYEGQREHQFAFFPLIVPDASVKTLALPVMRPLLKYLPPANGPEILDSTGTPTGLAQLNMRTYNNKSENNYQFRVDVALSNRDNFYFRGTESHGSGYENDQYTGPLTLLFSGYDIYSATLVENHTFSPHLVNEFRFGTNRQSMPYSSENLPGSNLMTFDSSGRPVDPFFNIGGTTSVMTYGGYGPVVQVPNVFQYTDNLSAVRGHHILKFGFDIRRTQINQDNNQMWYGNYQFPSVQAFEQDQPTLFYAVRGQAQYPRMANYSFYAQDDYSVSHNLTLNLGLRYEINAVIKEAHGRISNLEPLDDIANATAVLGATYNGDHNNFGPRVGLAWNIGGRQNSVLRAGFGVYYDTGPGYYGPVDLVANPPASFTPFLFGAAAAYPVPGSLLTPQNGLPGSVTAIPQNNRTPYSLQYNLTYQRSLPSNTTLTFSYVGSEGVHMYRLRPVNLNNPTTGLPINSQFSSINISEDSAHSSYNSGQFTVAHPFRDGLEMRASYTYSHSIDDSCGFAFYSGSPCTASNPFNLAADRASSSTDMRHNLTVAYLYQLPLQGLFRTHNRPRLLNGWELTGIFSAHSGLPYTVQIGYDSAGLGGGYFDPLRPNIVPGQPVILGPREGPNYELNQNAYAIPAPGQFGDLGRNTLRGAGFWNFDAGFFKTTQINERFKFQFRIEAFNLFNHPNFNVPGDNNSLVTPASSFGMADSVANPERTMQIGLKLIF